MAGQKKHSTRAHALLSPSGAERWINCTPSAMLESTEPDSTSNAALEGTTAHEVAELDLRYFLGNIKLSERDKALRAIQKDASKNLYHNDMLRHSSGYVSEIEGLMIGFLGVDVPRKHGDFEVEAKINMQPVTGEVGQFGHVDFMAWNKNRLLVCDYKYGVGTRVEARKNPQLRCYAVGALLQLNAAIDEIMVVIYQPRLNHLSAETMSADDLKQWHKDVVKPAAKLALDGAGKQKAGRWCKYCRVAGSCATLGAEAAKIARQEFDTVHLLTPEQQKQIYDKIGCVEAFMKALKADMLKKALAGVNFPGLKVVEANTKRKWADEETVKTLLELNGFDEDKIVRKSLNTIGDIEKLVGKKVFKEDFYMLTERPPGGPVLADEDDKRPAFNDAQKDFEEF